jgi:Short C-terminal domain
MKKLLLVVFLIPVFCRGQDSLVIEKKGKDVLYTASGFKVIVGQKLRLGIGSMPDGDFKYVRTSASSLFAVMNTSNNNAYANQANAASRSCSHLEYEVIRIDQRGNKRRGFFYYPILKGGFRYEVDIDNAIASGEIDVPEEFRPKQKEVKQNISVADELMKLKKLRDDSILTEEEYQSQKKKLLDK